MFLILGNKVEFIYQSVSPGLYTKLVVTVSVSFPSQTDSEPAKKERGPHTSWTIYLMDHLLTDGAGIYVGGKTKMKPLT